MRLRYDYSTQMCRERFHKIEKLGNIKFVKGYRYFGRYHTSHEAVLVVGENGSARFGGLLWGYNGQGPNGLKDLLLKLHVPEDKAEFIARIYRSTNIGEDWRLSFFRPQNSKVLYCFNSIYCDRIW